MSRKNLISVVIPVYNDAENIKTAVESVDGEDTEIIIVDDGSTDNTLQVCRELEKGDNRVKVFSQENKGQHIARMTAISHASGEYIMFLDSDDYYVGNTVERAAQTIEKYNHPDIVRFRFQTSPLKDIFEAYFDEQEKLVESKDFRELVYPMFVNSWKMNPLWASCVKKSVLDLANDGTIDVRCGEDLLLNMKIFSSIQNAVFIKDILYIYRHNNDSITKRNNPNQLISNYEDMITVYSRMYHYLLKWDMCSESNFTFIENRLKKDASKLFAKLNLRKNT